MKLTISLSGVIIIWIILCSNFVYCCGYLSLSLDFAFFVIHVNVVFIFWHNIQTQIADALVLTSVGYQSRGPLSFLYT